MLDFGCCGTDGRGNQAEWLLVGMRKPSNENIKVVGGRDVCAFNGGGRNNKEFLQKMSGMDLNYGRRGILPVCLG